MLSVSWAALVTTSGPRQPFCGACGNTASNSLRPADDPRPATTGAKSRAPTVNWPGPPGPGRLPTNPKPWPRWIFLCFRELVEAPWTSVCLSVTLCIFTHTSSQGRHRHRSVCADSERVVAATRRICAIFRRGARIAINSCARGSSTTKAIIAAPPLSGRTGDGATRRDSISRCTAVRY